MTWYSPLLHCITWELPSKSLLALASTVLGFGTDVNIFVLSRLLRVFGGVRNTEGI
jgi:hypothetical protein